MGTGVSLRGHGDDDDGLGTDYGHGVIKRIPIEMKPRGRLAGLKSVSSFGRKQPKGGSLRSALSIDLENPEVERIKKDFEMYRLNKDNEITNMQKKERKCETENKRLRSELLALQKMCTKLRNERDIAGQAEHQALARAAAFESDRDKVQRQFKIFRETKESEIQNLLRAKRDLENKLSKVAHGYIPDDLDTTSREDLDVNGESGNPGDWWTALESEPSFGSTMQLHQPMVRGPEFANSMMETEGPFTNVNKEDWSTASAKLTQMLPSIPENVPSNVLRVYISAPRDMKSEVDILEKEYMSDLEKLCQSEGRTLLSVHMPFNEHQSLSPEYLDRLSKARRNQLEKSSIFLAFLGEHTNRFSCLEFSCGHLDKPGDRATIFCFRDPTYKGCKPSQGEAKDLKNRVRDSGRGIVIDSYLNPNTGAEMAAAELGRFLKTELGIESESKQDNTDPYSNYSETDNPENLCGGALWDVHCDYEQLEALSYSVKSSCQLGFEKYYERLNNHVSAAGPLPPLLVSGAPGSGKSLLLAQWLQLQQGRNLNNLVMYHFVGQDFSVSGDPIVMMRRLTAQLMQHVTSPPALTCDPSRLVEEFPRWLEKVSSKTPGGAILVLDSIDRFQQGEQHLKWLLDPLPVDIRVIVSVNEDTCPLTWRSWPTLNIEPLSNKNVKELLRAELAIEDVDLDAEEECKILTHCRTPSTCNPLYVLVLSRAIIGCKYGDKISQVLDDLLQASDTVSLYKIVLQLILHEYDSHENKGIHKKILRYILLSRNGVSETELRFLIPGLRCNYLAPLGDVLMESLIITERSGVWTFAHPDSYVACESLLVTDEDQEVCDEARQELIQYFSSFLWPGKVTCRVADELPQLIKQTGSKDMMHRAILNLCVFQRLYARGRCAELISYWQFVDADKISMAQQYLDFVKKTEQYVGQFDGIVTLPRIADMNETLGRFLKDLGLLSQALPAFQRALELRETALDPDHPAVAKSLHQLAGLHAQWGKFSTAEALYKQALEIYENAFSSDHQMVAKELEALAVLYQKQDKHDLAEPLRKRSMSIRKKMRTPRMAAVHLRGITVLRRQALTMEELSTGSDSPELARTLNELGVLYYVQNNIDSAEAFFKRSLEIRESLLSDDHPDIAQSLKNLAALYNDRKEYDKAVPLYERSLKIRNKYLSPDHPSVASIIKHLAMLYKRQGKLSEAVPLYKTAVEIRETSFGDHHPSVATALVNLAVLYSQQNKFSQAEPLYERALLIYEESFGSQHPRVAETLRNLAVMKYEQRDYETAAKFYKRATEIKESDYTGKLRRSSSDETSSTLKNMLQT